jgi:hypothetical protein
LPVIGSKHGGSLSAGARRSDARTREELCSTRNQRRSNCVFVVVGAGEPGETANGPARSEVPLPSGDWSFSEESGHGGGCGGRLVKDLGPGGLDQQVLHRISPRACTGRAASAMEHSRIGSDRNLLHAYRQRMEHARAVPCRLRARGGTLRAAGGCA